jgi:integrase/recombinase XerD
VGLLVVQLSLRWEANMDLDKAIEGFNLSARANYAQRTAELFAQELVIIRRVWGNIEVESIRPDDVNRLMGYLKTDYIPFRIHQTGERLSEASQVNYWKTIRAFFKWANENLGIKRPDVNLSKPKYKMKEVQAFTAEEVKALAYHAEWTKDVIRKGTKTYRRHRTTYARDLNMIKVLLDTGLRLGELLRLRVEDVDQDGQVVVRPFGSSTKSKPRFVYLGKSTQHSLWVYLAKREAKPGERVFELDPETVRNILNRIGRAAGVTHVHPHRFRHTFAIEFLRHQKDPYSLQKLLGHSSMEMTQHYLEIAEDDLRQEHGIASPVDNYKLK